MAYPSIPLSTLLRLASPEGVVWASPAPDDTLVTWVMGNVELAKGGEAWLVDSQQVSVEHARLAQKHGIVVIIVVGMPVNLPQFSQVGIPVVCLPHQTDFVETFRMLLTILVNQRAHLMEWGNKFSARLSQLEAEGAGLNALVEELREMSGKAVLVQDKYLSSLAQSIPAAFRPTWEKISLHLEDVESLPIVLRDRKEAGKQNALLSQGLTETCERLVAPINVGGMARGYLSLVGRVGELDDLDRVIVEQGAEVVAMEMSRSKAIRETEKRLKGDWLSALLQGELSPRDARLWTQEIGLDMAQAHVCLRFCWSADAHPSYRRLETLVNGEVARSELKVLVTQLEEEVVCFCEVGAGQARPDSAIALGRSVLDKAMLNFPDSNPRCGIGFPASELASWNETFRQAGQALEMARRLSENRPLYFPDLSVYRLLLQVEHSPELSDFYQELLGPLLGYESGDELIKTLDAYFERNGNLKKTANALYIHRNTLLYRLERIKEITGLDLDDPETRLALQLTLRIHKMLGQPPRQRPS